MYKRSILAHIMFKLKIRMQIYVIINKLTVASTIAYMQFSINNE